MNQTYLDPQLPIGSFSKAVNDQYVELSKVYPKTKIDTQKNTIYVPLTLPNFDVTVRIILPDGFPSHAPLFSVAPVVSCAYVDASGNVSIPPLATWKSTSTLLITVRYLHSLLQTLPKASIVLKPSVQYGSPVASNAQSSNQYTPSDSPSNQASRVAKAAALAAIPEDIAVINSKHVKTLNLSFLEQFSTEQLCSLLSDAEARKNLINSSVVALNTYHKAIKVVEALPVIEQPSSSENSVYEIEIKSLTQQLEEERQKSDQLKVKVAEIETRQSKTTVVKLLNQALFDIDNETDEMYQSYVYTPEAASSFNDFYSEYIPKRTKYHTYNIKKKSLE